MLTNGLIDITGNRYGRLIVIEQAATDPWTGKANWLCLCDCGTEKKVLGELLRRGKTNSCGCLRKELSSARTTERLGITLKQKPEPKPAPVYSDDELWQGLPDLTMLRYGRLLVIGRCEYSQNGEPVWECHCDCGNYAAVTTSSLKKGTTKSCGCLRRELSSARAKQLKGPKPCPFIGITLGWSTVIGKDNVKDHKGSFKILLQCFCGNTFSKRADKIKDAIKNGKRKHCGCINGLESAIDQGRLTVTEAIKKNAQRSKSKQPARKLF